MQNKAFSFQWNGSSEKRTKECMNFHFGHYLFDSVQLLC